LQGDWGAVLAIFEHLWLTCAVKQVNYMQY